VAPSVQWRTVIWMTGNLLSPPGRAGISSCLLIQTGSDPPVGSEDFFLFCRAQCGRSVKFTTQSHVVRVTTLPLPCASL
jgi:hypothetical protein